VAEGDVLQFGNAQAIVAVTVVAEVGDFQCFDNPRQLMAYLVHPEQRSYH
jgi:transposase